MNTPFTEQQFFEVFAQYNAAVWPWQLVLTAAAAGVAIFAWRRPQLVARVVPFFLAMLWVWSGVAYHFAHLSRVNPAAWLFGGLFVLQGMLWIWATRYRRLAFATDRSAAWTVGAVGIAYALVIYPLLGTLLGHGYPSSPTFGAPCPSTIFTFGILLWTAGTVPVRLLIIPTMWAVLAAPAAIGWGVLEDVAMPVTAVMTVVILAIRNHGIRRKRVEGLDARSRPSTVPPTQLANASLNE